MRPDVRDLIGIPFLDRGRDPSQGLDCWGLFRIVQARFGNNVPDYAISALNPTHIGLAVAENIGQWEKIDQPEPGCAVLMALLPNHPKIIQHFGILIEEGKFIHTLSATGACLSSIHHPFWARKIRGFYRWNKNC